MILSKSIAVISAVLMIFVAGCDSWPEDETVNYFGAETEAGDAPAENGDAVCDPVALEKISCTAGSGAGGLPSEGPALVAKRMHGTAQAAINECYNFNEIYWAYSQAMDALNSGDMTPAEVEHWFTNYIRNVIGYDPGPV